MTSWQIYSFFKGGGRGCNNAIESFYFLRNSKVPQSYVIELKITLLKTFLILIFISFIVITTQVISASCTMEAISIHVFIHVLNNHQGFETLSLLFLDIIGS